MADPTSRAHRLGIVITLATAVVFGFWPPAVRGIYAEGGNVVFALLATTWVRALTLGGFCLLRRQKLFQNRYALHQALLGGFSQVVTLVTVYIALEYIAGPLMIIILFSHTTMLLFLYLLNPPHKRMINQGLRG